MTAVRRAVHADGIVAPHGARCVASQWTPTDERRQRYDAARLAAYALGLAVSCPDGDGLAVAELRSAGCMRRYVGAGGRTHAVSDRV